MRLRPKVTEVVCAALVTLIAAFYGVEQYQASQRDTARLALLRATLMRPTSERLQACRVELTAGADANAVFSDQDETYALLGTFPPGVRLQVRAAWLWSGALGYATRRPPPVPSYYKRRFSILYKAAQTRDLALADLLLQKGADPNRRIAGISTPLTFAVAQGDIAMIRLLLLKGADPAFADGKGRTPLQIASIYSNIKVERLLRDALGENYSVVTTPGKQP